MTFNKTSFWICVKSSLPPKFFSHQMASRSINSRACTHHRYLSLVKKLIKKVYEDLVLSTKKKYYVKSSKFRCHVNVAYLHIPFFYSQGSMFYSEKYRGSMMRCSCDVSGSNLIFDNVKRNNTARFDFQNIHSKSLPSALRSKVLMQRISSHRSSYSD